MIGQIRLKNTKILTISSWILLYATLACNKKPVDPNPQPKLMQEKPVFKDDFLGTSTSSGSMEILTPERLQEVMNPNEPADTLFVFNYFATWCHPCVKEIPYFKNEMDSRKGQKIKFVFISRDEKESWNTVLPKFVQNEGIASNTKIVPKELLNSEFYILNFKEIRGEGIPFTKICKNGKCKEYLGDISEQRLKSEIDSFH